ncbi:MAG: hypothetical protein V1882_02695 [Candidatus Omnitrophota bacterium]
MKFIASFVLDALSVPGKLMITPDRSGKCGKARFVFGVAITALLQSYVYLIYVAFVSRWTMSALHDQGVQKVVLFAAIFAVFFPVGSRLGEALKGLGEEERFYRKELAEASNNKANERERGLGLAAQTFSIVFIMTIIGAVVFSVFQESASMLYGKTFSLLGGLFVRYSELWFGGPAKS